MKLMEYLQRKPSLYIAFVIITVCICIVIMAILILFRLQRENQVTKAAIELNKITNSIKAGLVHFILEDDFRILYASKGFYELLGYSKKEIKDENKNSLLDFVFPKDLKIFTDLKEKQKGETINVEARMVTKSEKIIFVLITGNSVLGKDGNHTVSAVLVDISEQKHMQEVILLEGERYRIASELSNDVLFEYNIKTDVIIFTEKYRDLFGRNTIFSDYTSECEARRDLIHPDDWGIYLEICSELSKGKDIIEAEYRLKDRLSNYIWCQIKGKTIYDDEGIPIRVIGKIVNIDIQKKELEALEYKATRDPLTGVYNKEITIKKIEKFINGSKNGKHILMFIDFDDFKMVNDNYGHLLGDKVLTYVIGRIKSVFTEGEIIGRIGGDEFIVFSGNIKEVEDVLNKAEVLIHALDTTYIDNGRAIPISGSIGIASYPEDGMHYEQLIQCADKALYLVKREGKNNYRLYSEPI